MSCKLTQRYVPGYLDEELDLSHTIEMEAHLESCDECARELARQQALRAAFQRNSLAYAAPAGFRDRIQASLASLPQGNSATDGAEVRERARPLSIVPGLRWAAAFAVLVLVAVTGWRYVASLRPPTAGRQSAQQNDQQLAAEVFASHVRSLEASHLMDVASTDQHTVKPWFDGKLDFSPPVEDFAGDGFPLVGGRLDYLQSREVAALIYQRRKHIINVFAWPGVGGPSPPQRVESKQGYNLMRWSDGGFQFWAVSDVSAADLSEFVRLWEARGAPQAN